jgi:hypothetical protein
MLPTYPRLADVAIVDRRQPLTALNTASGMSLIAIPVIGNDDPSMTEDMLHRVNRLIRECRERAGPAPSSPEDVRRHVALALGVAETVAEDLILEAGSRGANPFRQG